MAGRLDGIWLGAPKLLPAEDSHLTTCRVSTSGTKLPNNLVPWISQGLKQETADNLDLPSSEGFNASYRVEGLEE